ncbi:MAG: hypothetical protein Fur0032_11760 [Terrimicrobiaceae bacterium]
MKLLIPSFCLAVMAIESLSAAEFNLGLAVGGDATAFPSTAKGFLVADASGDGFELLADAALLRGATGKSAGSLLGDDDVIFSINLALVDFGGGTMGFSFPETAFDLANFPSLSSGDAFAIVWFPSGVSNSGSAFSLYRSDSFDPAIGATSGFFLPAAGDTSTVVALGEGAGGNVTSSQFQTNSGTVPNAGGGGSDPVDWSVVLNTKFLARVGEVDAMETDPQTQVVVVPLTMKTATSGTAVAFFAGRMTRARTSYKISGELLSDGVVLLKVSSRSGVISEELVFDDSSGSPRFVGSVAFEAGEPVPFEILPAAYAGKGTDLSPLAGRTLNVAITQSAADTSGVAIGHGFCTMKLGADGSAKVAGILPNGVKFRASALAHRSESDSSELVVIAVLPGKPPGRLIGRLVVPDSPGADEADIEGGLLWVQSPNPKSTFEPSGFTAALDAIGLVWQVPTGNALGGSADLPFLLEVDPNGDTAFGSQTFSGTWPTTNKPTFPASLSAPSIRFNAKAGTFTGSFPAILGGKKVKAAFSGVLLSAPVGTESIQGFGYIFDKSASGEVEITTQ